jgi:hypothetical protein
VNELRWETRLLAVVAATLVVFGIAMTYGASSLVRTKDGGVAGGAFALTQLTGALLGGVLMVTMARIDYRRLRPLAWPLLLVTIFFLFIPILPFTRSISPVINGARRWVQLGPINFQPSELARLAVILWCAMLAAKKGEQVRQFKKGVLPFVVVLGFVSLLIVLQPNLSMATLIALLGGIVLFTAGAKIGHFLVLGFVAVLLVFQKIHDAQYRLARFTAFMSSGDSPDAATSQIHQSFVGIGSGGLFGWDSVRASRDSGISPTPTPISSSARLGRSGGSSAFADRAAVCSVLLARIPDRSHRRGALRSVSRDRSHRGGWTHRVHAHGGDTGHDADDGPHAPLHLLWALESGRNSDGHRDPAQRRENAR